MELEVITLITYFLCLVSVVFFLKYNDEFPLLIILFFIATGLTRYQNVVEGIVDWVEVNYAFSLFTLNNELALEALNLFLLGTVVLFFTYIVLKKKKNKNDGSKDNNTLFYEFLNSKRKLILLLFLVFLGVNSITKAFLGSGGVDLAYGNSYAFLFRLAIGGIILLVFLIYKRLKFRQQLIYKSSLFLILIFSAYISYNPGVRFQFLSWMIALAILVLKDTSPIKKLQIYVIGGVLIVLFFSLAGVARYKNLDFATWEEKFDLALERASKTEDQNMLDGFMMVLQVYPHELDFHYGMEHLEILLRPIPRSLWPGKPVGGYVNKLKLNEGDFQGTIGISQSIYGTFYGEGGVLGIVIFSILYGYLFIKLFRYAQKYNSDLRYLLKGIIIASSLAIFRGGDIPGIIAFVGMSYWPVFLMLYQYNKFLIAKKPVKKSPVVLKSNLNPHHLPVFNI